MMRELEETKQPPTIHPQTAAAISNHLDLVQRLTQESKVRAMVLCALLTEGAHPKGKALTLFGAPNGEKGVAMEVWHYAYEWLHAVAAELEPPEPEDAS